MKHINFKPILFIFLLAFVTIPLMSQDLIVTNLGDSINCRITKIRSGYVYFLFNDRDEVRSTLLSIDQVKSHQTGYFQTNGIRFRRTAPQRDYPRYKVAAGGGWSWRIASLPDDVPDDFEQYYRDLKSGGHFGGDVTYYISEKCGVGLKYSMFRSKNELDNIWVRYGNGPIQYDKYGMMSDDMTIQYIGSFYSSRRFYDNNRKCLFMNVGMGYMAFENKARVVDRFTLTGSTLGFNFDIGYDIEIAKNLSLGIQLSLLSGSLSEYQRTDAYSQETIELDEDNFDDLSRIDLSVGLRFNK